MANTQNKEKKIKKINEKHKCDIKSNSLKLENNKCFVATILGYFINFLHEVVNGSFCHNRGDFIEVSRCLSSSVWVLINQGSRCLLNLRLSLLVSKACSLPLTFLSGIIKNKRFKYFSWFPYLHWVTHSPCNYHYFPSHLFSFSPLFWQ